MNALPPLITDHLDEVRALCEKYHVKRLTLFGSAVKGTFGDESDVDLVVEFFPESDPIRAGRSQLKFWNELERLFARKVDLVDLSAVRNPYLAASIRRHLHDLYEAA